MWKSERQLKRAKEQTEREKKTEAAVKAGRSMGISGRELFTFNPNLFEMSDDDEAWDGDYTQREEEDQGDDNHERGAPKAFDASLFAAESLEGLSVDDLEEGDK